MGKKKQGICMADGGITKETPDQLMARMAQKYGTPAAGIAAPPVQAVQQNQEQPKVQPQQSTPKGILGILSGRGAQIDKASNYANGGIVKGKGTPTSDDVPVKIKGKDFNLSDTEAVLPGKTRQALGEMLGAKPGDVAQANAMVENFIEKTNGKPPVSVEDGTNLAVGGLTDEEARRMDYQGVTGIAAPSPIPAPVAAPAPTGGMSLSKGQAPTIYDNGGLPADVVQRGIATMRGQLAKPGQSSAVPTSSVAAPLPTPAKPVTDMSSGPTVSDGAGGVYTPESGSSGAGILSGISNFFKDSAQAARGEKSYEQIRAERDAGQVTPATGQSMNNGQAAVKVDPFGATPDKFAVPANTDSTFITGKAGAKPDSSGGGFTQGNTSFNVNPSTQEGIAKITATSKNPLYTNIKPEDAVSGLKNQMIGGGAADVKEGLDRFARANAINQQRIDAQPVGGIAVLPDQNEADNAEKTARWRQDDLISQASRGNQAAIVSAINSVPDMAKNGIAATSEANRNAIAMRGQDLTAKNEAARLAGTPIDNQIKQNQAAAGAMTNAQAKQLADLHDAYNSETDPAKRKVLYENIRAMSGKDAASKYLVVPGGEFTDPENPLVKMKAPSRVLDTSTGQFTDASPVGAKTAPAVDQKTGKPAAPKVGQVVGGHKYIGGNPADPKSWEQA